MTGQIIVTNEGTTRIITLRRPGKKNAITQDMYREMGHAIDGDDIDHFLNADMSRPEALSNGARFLYSLPLNVKPIIAAVDGSPSALELCCVPLRLCARVGGRDVLFTLHRPGSSSCGGREPIDATNQGHQRAFAMLVMGRTFTAEEAQMAGFVNAAVSPGHTETEARKVAREICRLPVEAVAISRKLQRGPPEDLTRRIDRESHLFGEHIRSNEAVAAFNAFAARKKR